MRIALLIPALIAFAASVQPAVAEGALAITPNSDRYGFSHSYDNRNSANQRALQECGGGCRVVLNFDGQCAAYAVDTRQGSDFYGWGMQATGASAQARALQECQSRAGYGPAAPVALAVIAAAVPSESGLAMNRRRLAVKVGGGHLLRRRKLAPN